MQLERAQSDGDKLATDAAATSGHAAATAAAATELRLLRLEGEAQMDEIARLKAAAADAAAARAEAATHTDAVGQFLVQCMRDVKGKVVEVHEDGGDEGAGAAAITVLPGVQGHTNCMMCPQCNTIARAGFILFGARALQCHTNTA